MLLEPMVARLRVQRDIASSLGTACRDLVALHGAEFGNVQLVGDDAALWLVHGVGLSAEFIEAASRLDPDSGTVCTRALQRRKTVHVSDLTLDPSFEPVRSLAAETGFRAVISSPLISTAGELIGVLSSHFANPKVPTAIELHTRESYCRQLADHLLSKSSAAELAAQAQRLALMLLRRSKQAAAG